MHTVVRILKPTQYSLSLKNLQYSLLYMLAIFVCVCLILFAAFSRMRLHSLFNNVVYYLSLSFGFVVEQLSMICYLG